MGKNGEKWGWTPPTYFVICYLFVVDNRNRIRSNCEISISVYWTAEISGDWALHLQLMSLGMS